jgi:hypothetical protein
MRCINKKKKSFKNIYQRPRSDKFNPLKLNAPNGKKFNGPISNVIGGKVQLAEQALQV